RRRWSAPRADGGTDPGVETSGEAGLPSPRRPQSVRGLIAEEGLLVLALLVVRDSQVVVRSAVLRIELTDPVETLDGAPRLVLLVVRETEMVERPHRVGMRLQTLLEQPHRGLVHAGL